MSKNHLTIVVHILAIRVLKESELYQPTTNQKSNNLKSLYCTRETIRNKKAQPTL